MNEVCDSAYFAERVKREKGVGGGGQECRYYIALFYSVCDEERSKLLDIGKHFRHHCFAVKINKCGVVADICRNSVVAAQKILVARFFSGLNKVRCVRHFQFSCSLKL